jgi:membrane-associated protease RseP (regulator of RpoE activity)
VTSADVEPAPAEPTPPPGDGGDRADLGGVVVMVGLIVALGVFVSWWAVALVGALAVIIFLHELGHYVTAKAAGMKVTEFFLGFGPRIWSFRRGETEYGLKAVPAGAYVRIIGMSNLEEIDPADEERTYRSKPYWRRLSVAVAGSTMHFIIAFVLVFAVFVGFGVRDANSESWTVQVQDDGPAAAAGLRDGDRIVRVDGQPAGEFADASAELRRHPGEEVTLVVERDGEELTLTPVLADRHPVTGERVGYLGVMAVYPTERTGLVEGLGEAVSASRTAAWQSIVGIGRLFSPDGLEGYYDNVRGRAEPRDDGLPDENRPTSIVGIVDVGSQAAEEGVVNLVWLLFVVNIFIGVFNLLPLLPFDGGHVVIATYEKIRSMIARRPYHADVAKLMPLTYAVVALLAVLFVTSVWMDIVDPVKLQ